MTQHSEFINLKEYPIHDKSAAPYRDLVLRARKLLKTSGYVALPNFICKTGLERIKAQCLEVIEQRPVRGNQVGRAVNCYYTVTNDDLSSDHPQNILFDRQFGVIRDDMIREDDGIRQVYDNPLLVQFVAEVLESPELHQSRDNYQALTVNVMGDGDHLHWHFDCNACAVTLGIQVPEGGGQFEFVPFIGREEYAQVSAVMAAEPGTAPNAKEFCTEEGMLVFFCGGESIHCVRPVVGPRCRMVAALQFHTSPDAHDPPEMTRRIYGVPVEEHLGPKQHIVSAYIS